MALRLVPPGEREGGPKYPTSHWISTALGKGAFQAKLLAEGHFWRGTQPEAPKFPAAGEEGVPPS